MTPDQIRLADGLIGQRNWLKLCLKKRRIVIAAIEELPDDYIRIGPDRMDEIPLPNAPDLRPYVQAEIERIEAKLRELGVDFEEKP